MPDAQAIPIGPNEPPLPMGVWAESGDLLPGLRPTLRHIDEDPNARQARGFTNNTDFLAPRMSTPTISAGGLGYRLSADARSRRARGP